MMAMGAGTMGGRCETGGMRSFITRRPEDTEALAAGLGNHLPPDTVIALEGELGAGKTCFVRGLARGLGSPEPVSSPTFTLMQEVAGGRLGLYHFDAWMEGREEAFLEGGGADWLSAGGVAAVEWSEKVHDLLPFPRLRVSLRHLGPEERGLILELVRGSRGRDSVAETLLGALQGAVEALEVPGGVQELAPGSVFSPTGSGPLAPDFSPGSEPGRPPDVSEPS